MDLVSVNNLSADPALVGVEHFDYADGPIVGKTGGMFWDLDNSTENGPFFGHSGTVSNWNVTAGNPQVVGGKLITNNSGAKREYNGPSEGIVIGGDEHAGAVNAFANFDHDAVYYLFTMTRPVGATWSGASSMDFGTERYLFGVPGTANPASGQREFAIHDLNTNTHAYSGIQPVAGQTYTLVAKLDWGNTVAALYLNPDLSQPESSQIPVATYPHTSENWSTAIRLASGSGGNVEWDDVRVTAAWTALTDFDAVDDSVTMHHGNKVRIRVLDNDGGSIDSTSVSVMSGPSSGLATVSADGSILYEHTLGTPLSDSFSYEVMELGGGATDVGTVTISFSEDARFGAAFVDFPDTAPVTTALRIEDAFPGLTFDSPHGFAGVPGDATKLFVAEGDGRVYMVPDISAFPTDAEKVLVLDISAQVNHDNNEKAMKGIAVHPNWSSNGFIYVTYNSSNGRVRVSRFTCQTSAPFTAGSEQVLIDQLDPSSFHNIASCKFGPDGYLYVGFGDGDSGGQNDSQHNSQHIDKNLWSCILRIDVDSDPGNLIPNPDSDIPRVAGGASGEAFFRVPVDNPFVGVSSFNGITLNPNQVRTEMVVVGQRNPWQFSPEDHDGNGSVDEIWVADVGRSLRDEVGVYTMGGNGGWAWREGNVAGARSGQLINGAAQSAASLTAPRWQYGHGGGTYSGSSIIGGFIYRGSALPSLTGKYVFADYESGNVWSLDPAVPTLSGGNGIERLGGEVGVVALMEDPSNGDVLLLDRGNTGGNQGTGGIKRVTISPNDSSFPLTLSETQFFADLSDITPNPGAVAYSPNLRFWSDSAEKKRWFLINNTNDTVTFKTDGPWGYPDDMVWVKHFDYPTDWESFNRSIDGQVVADRRPLVGSMRRRLETRFLVRTSSGSYGISYQWNNTNGGVQDEATLAHSNGVDFGIDITLDGSPVSVPWRIPSRTECMTCHTPEAGHALSFNTPQLNGPGEIMGISGNFIDRLDLAGYLTGYVTNADGLPRHLRPDETTYSLEARVRSYLDVNCSYCHKAGGTGGGNWDGREHLTLAQTGLINQEPVDAPVVVGDLLVTPGLVQKSILLSRMSAANGYSRMPSLGTNEVDWEGVQLLADWISQEVQPYTTYQQWRMAKFGSGSSAEGEEDANPDGDSADNHFEWLTNTNPVNASDVWSPVFSIVGSSVSLSFSGLGNRSVRAFRSANLTDWSPWVVPGNDGQPLNPSVIHALSGPSHDPAEFFRFEVNER